MLTFPVLGLVTPTSLSLQSWSTRTKSLSQDLRLSSPFS